MVSSHADAARALLRQSLVLLLLPLICEEVLRLQFCVRNEQRKAESLCLYKAGRNDFQMTTGLLRLDLTALSYIKVCACATAKCTET